MTSSRSPRHVHATQPRKPTETDAGPGTPHRRRSPKLAFIVFIAANAAGLAVEHRLLAAVFCFMSGTPAALFLLPFLGVVLLVWGGMLVLFLHLSRKYLPYRERPIGAFVPSVNEQQALAGTHGAPDVRLLAWLRRLAMAILILELLWVAVLLATIFGLDYGSPQSWGMRLCFPERVGR